MTFLSCHSFFYYPDSKVHYDPKKLGYDYQEIFLQLGKDRLSAWFFPAKKQAKAVVMQLHGNAQNISSHYLSLVWLTQEGFHFYTFDYRGYGQSSGKASPENTIEDALCAFRYLISQKEFQNLPVILYGQSLGGKIAQDFLAFLTPEEMAKISGVILEGSFSSYRKIAVEKLWESGVGVLFIPLAYLLVKEPEIPKTSAKLPPFLVIHGKKDQVVDYKNGVSLAQKYKAPLLTVENGGHLDAYILAREKILAYLNAFSYSHK